MGYIKLFEGFQSKSKVAQFCLEYNIRDWSINSEGLVDVNGDVKLYNSGLNKIPIKFGKIIGYFDCSNNELKSLEGSPHTVVGDFDCSNNELKSLEGCTHTVGGNFYCQYNQLTIINDELEFVEYFDISYNPIDEVFKLFPDFKSFKYSLDYNYLRYPNQIVKNRFEEACEEAGISLPQKIKGYEYI
jgi:hypothetical protein